MFGVLFVHASYPIPVANLQQVDPTHWVLDVCSTVRPDYWELKEAALFLTAPIDAAAALGLYVKAGSSEWLYRGCVHNGQPSEVGGAGAACKSCRWFDAALGLYVKAGSSEWLYRGCVHNGQPSEVVPLQWPGRDGGEAVAPAPGAVQIGISLEPLADLAGREGSRLGNKVDYARRVGMDLVHFMQSYPTQLVNGGEVMLVPANVLNQWFSKFEGKFKRDPDFLTRQKEQL